MAHLPSPVGTRGSCLLVVAVVALGLSGGAADAQTGTSWQPAPTAVVRAVTRIPASVFDRVGLQPGVTPPVALQSQPALKFAKKPGVLYLSSEPCPLCAAERWAFIAATARFGKWSRLGIAQSATDDVYPNTQTFTFLRASFSSPYIGVKTVELLGSRQLADGTYEKLQQPTAHQEALVSRYDTAQYFPENAGSLPFLDFGNQFVVAGPSYDPAVLAGQSREQIAADLSQPTKPTTSPVVAAANYLTAAICAIDGQRPASVCHSAGVTRAAGFADVVPQAIGACAPAPKKQPVCATNGSSAKG
jgi:Domain of unknown function (DUF929)